MRVDVFPASYVKNSDSLVAIGDVVDHPVVPNPNPPPVAPPEFGTPNRSRIKSEGTNDFTHTDIALVGKSRELLLCATEDEDGVGHALFERSISISTTACAKGTASSPEVLAAS